MRKLLLLSTIAYTFISIPSVAQENSDTKSEFHGDGMRFSLDVRKQLICTGEETESDKLIVRHMTNRGYVGSNTNANEFDLNCAFPKTDEYVSVVCSKTDNRTSYHVVIPRLREYTWKVSSRTIDNGGYTVASFNDMRVNCSTSPL